MLNVKSILVLMLSLLSALAGGVINMRLESLKLYDEEVLLERIQSVNASHSDVGSIYEVQTAENDITYISGVNMNTVHKIVDNVLYCSDDAGTGTDEFVSNRTPILYRYVVPDNIYNKCMQIYISIMSDVRCFPVALDIKGGVGVSYEDSWGNDRNYGGSRKHEGTDIMADNNVRGYFPVVSMTDGTVEKVGWLKLGGYRIGIRSPSGAYYYYAHLAEYADGIQEGMKINAGAVIGTMGDTGYSEKEGTTGNFPVHLHLGIYLDVDGEEKAFNPYYILKSVERYRREFI